MGEQINAFKMNCHVQLMNTLLKNGNTFFQVLTSTVTSELIVEQINCFLASSLTCANRPYIVLPVC